MYDYYKHLLRGYYKGILFVAIGIRDSMAHSYRRRTDVRLMSSLHHVALPKWAGLMHTNIRTLKVSLYMPGLARCVSAR